MGETGKPEGVREAWDKYKYGLLVALCGVGLMVLPEMFQREQAAPVPAAVSESRDIQSELEAILGEMRGVGQVRVMLTEGRGGGKTLAQDTVLSFRGAGTSPEDYSRSTETVLVDGADGRAAVVVQTTPPEYRGALVVCEGGGDARVKLAVTRAVSALTGLSADRVAVEEWRS